jgi:hypothetical protein
MMFYGCVGIASAIAARKAADAALKSALDMEYRARLEWRAVCLPLRQGVVTRVNGAWVRSDFEV